MCLGFQNHGGSLHLHGLSPVQESSLTAIPAELLFQNATRPIRLKLKVPTSLGNCLDYCTEKTLWNSCNTIQPTGCVVPFFKVACLDNRSILLAGSLVHWDHHYSQNFLENFGELSRTVGGKPSRAVDGELSCARNSASNPYLRARSHYTIPPIFFMTSRTVCGSPHLWNVNKPLYEPPNSVVEWVENSVVELVKNWTHILYKPYNIKAITVFQTLHCAGFS